jgi:2-polyprenyl-3-methyl-5-hydroxy-6-metoxy-1,4-benzoquinol methylase
MKRIREQNVNTKEFWDVNWVKTELWTIGTSVLTDRLAEMSKNIHARDRVLDVGGGRGEIAAWIRERTGCFITVAEIAPSGVAACLKRGIPAFECDFLNLSNAIDDHLDVVYSGELLEHADDPSELIRQMVSVCKPGGWLALSTPFEDRWNHEPTHVWSFSLEDVGQLLVPYGTTEVVALSNGFKDGPGCIVGHCHLKGISDE